MLVAPIRIAAAASLCAVAASMSLHWAAARPAGPAGRAPSTTPPATGPPASAHRANLTSRPADLAAVSAEIPVRLVIDGIHVDSKVVPVGVAADGQLALPADVRTVGWYALGPGTGAAGTALFAAHVDEGAEEGLFFSLRSLPVGSAISVTTADGRVHDYRVLARRIVAKQHLQPQLLESVAGPPRLLLVTCGGAFNHATRSYASNVLVWAAAAA